MTQEKCSKMLKKLTHIFQTDNQNSALLGVPQLS